MAWQASVMCLSVMKATGERSLYFAGDTCARSQLHTICSVPIQDSRPAEYTQL